MNNIPSIEPVPEMVADTRKLCEIRFDCLVTMYDVGFARYKGMWGQEKQSNLISHNFLVSATISGTGSIDGILFILIKAYIFIIH